MGDATKIDEYVPIKMPTIIAKANPRSTSPPNINRTTTTSKVVRDVMNVRLSVSLKDLFTSRSKVSVLNRFENSRIRSKTTTVSLMEYPTIVKNAAMIVWSI